MTARTAPYFPKTIGTGDGTETEYTIGFPFLHQDHLRVIQNGVLKTIVTDYTIVDGTDRVNAKVKFVAAPTAGHVIKIERNTPIAQYTANPQVGNQAAMQALFRMQEAMDQRIVLRDQWTQAELLAGTALSFVAPCDGFIEKLKSVVLTAVTTGGPITVEVDAVAVTGLTVSIADAAPAGTVAEDVPTTAQSATTKVKKGQTITVTPDALFATAGSAAIELEIQPGDLT
jgi:hypothetical protein